MPQVNAMEIYEKIKEEYCRRKKGFAIADEASIDNAASSPSFVMLIRSIRMKAAQALGSRSADDVFNNEEEEENDVTRNAVRMSTYLRPLFYSTPDGALHPTLCRRKFKRPKINSSEALPSLPTIEEYRGGKPPVRAAGSADKLIAARAVLLASDDSCEGSDNVAPMRREESSFFLSAAMLNELMEMLMDVGLSTATDVGQNKEIFALEERVELLYTILFLLQDATASSSTKEREGGAEVKKEKQEKMSKSGKGKEEKDVNSQTFSLLCKDDLERLAVATCDILREVIQKVLEFGEKKDLDEEESGRLLRLFIIVTDIISIIFGAKSSCYRQQLLATCDECGVTDDEKSYSYTKLDFSIFFQSLTMQGYDFMLCCNFGVLSHQFLLTALKENGLWHYLWHNVIGMFFGGHEKQGKPGGEESKHGEALGDGAVILDDGGIILDFLKMTQTICVQLTLNIMTSLLLVDVANGKNVFFDVLSSLRTFGTDEEEIDTTWLRVFTQNGKRGSHRPLHTAEKCLVYTLQRLSDFLVFRRVSYYAANTMHVLLTRLLVLPRPAEIDTHVVLSVLFFMAENRLLFSLVPPQEITSNETRLNFSDKSFDGDNTAYINYSAPTSLSSRVLNSLMHFVSFHLSLYKPKLSLCEPENNKNLAPAAATVNSDLVVLGALLSILLLLEQKEPEKIDAKNQHFLLQGWQSIEAMITGHNLYSTCEGSSWLQTALSAGLGRTHQVALFFFSLAENDVSQLPNLLRLVGPHITGFSYLVRANTLGSLMLHRKTLDAEDWAERLTIALKGSLSGAAFSTVGRRKNFPTTFSCTVTCPAWPAGTELRDGRFKSVGAHQAAAGEEDASPRTLEVYMRTLIGPETATKSGGGGGCGGGGALRAVASPPHPKLEKEEDTLPPMMFGYESVSLNDNRRGCRISGWKLAAASLVQYGRTSCNNECGDSFFEEPGCACVAHNFPCGSLLHQKSVIYAAAVDMIIWTGRVYKEQISGEKEERNKDLKETRKKLEEWPLNSVIIACCTLYGDELYLFSQPPERHALLSHGGQKEHSPEGNGKSKRALSRQERRRAAAAKRKLPLCFTNVMLGKSLICTSLRCESDFTTFSREPRAKIISEVRELPTDSSKPFVSNCNNKNGDYDDDDDDDARLADLDAYVKNIEPHPITDILLQEKNQTISFLQQRLGQSTTHIEELQRRLEEITAQREELTNLLTERQLEVQLCHDDIVAPLRREVTLLRHSLSLRNQELSLVISICHKLRSENESMATTIRNICTEVESTAQQAEKP